MGNSNGQHQVPIMLGSVIRTVKISMLQDIAPSALGAEFACPGSTYQLPPEHAVEPCESVSDAFGRRGSRLSNSLASMELSLSPS